MKRIVYFFIAAFVFWLLIFANYGIADFIKNRREILHLQNLLNITQNEKQALVKKVSALSGPDIDQDLLEIQAREFLPFVRCNEVVYFWK